MSRQRDAAGDRVVLLNGPAGVGKTTLGRRLAATARNGVCIHGDDLKRFVVAREAGTVEQGLSYVGGAALADVFLDAGYDLVVVEFIFARREHVERFRRALRSDVAVDLVTLWAPLATVAEREVARPNRDRLDGRLAECWHELAAHLGELGAVIDARGSVEQVLAVATRRIEDGAARLGGYPGALSSDRHNSRQAPVRQGRQRSPSSVSSAGVGSPGRP
jgi:chloramphenicol 3-O-phosphotransferase